MYVVKEGGGGSNNLFATVLSPVGLVDNKVVPRKLAERTGLQVADLVSRHTDVEVALTEAVVVRAVLELVLRSFAAFPGSLRSQHGCGHHFALLLVTRSGEVGQAGFNYRPRRRGSKETRRGDWARGVNKGGANRLIRGGWRSSDTISEDDCVAYKLFSHFQYQSASSSIAQLTNLLEASLHENK